MENEENKRIVLRDLVDCKEIVNPLELHLVPKERKTDERTEEYRLRERPSTLTYTFERH